MKLLNLIGRKIGRLRVIERAANDGKGRARWTCKCDCGSKTVIQGSSLATGKTQSCGCLNRDVHRTHGGPNTSEFRAWTAMRSRCSDQNNPAYRNYGARGIKVCARWDRSFSSFRRDMGKKPQGKSIERKNNNGNYTPSNCVWATRNQQANNRRTNRQITIRGKTRSLAEWCKISGVRYHLAHGRLLNGWPAEAAIFSPVGIKGKPHAEALSVKSPLDL